MMAIAPASLWMEIDVDCVGGDVTVSARTREQVVQGHCLGPEITPSRLAAFSKRVADAAGPGHLPTAVIDEARAIRRAVIDGPIDRMRSQLRGAAGVSPVLVRWMIRPPELQSVPWEALCDPDEANGFWGLATDYLIARGVRDAEPSRIGLVPGALNVLVVAPLGGASIENIRQALQERIATREIAWLPPIGPDQACPEYVFDRLAMEPRPHVLHFVGHGGRHNDKPALQLTSATGEPTWIDAEMLAMRLHSAANDSVRLIVLEACEGARPGAFASAAEELCRKGTEAVVAHLWPVRADLARRCSDRFYRTLVSDGARLGDAAAALNEARRALFTLDDETPQAFSPVLYLRSNDARLFDVTRRPEPPEGGEDNPTAQEVVHRRKLAKVVGHGRPFSLVLGDRWPSDLQAFERLKKELLEELSAHGSRPLPPDLPSSAFMERAELELGPLVETKFQEVVRQDVRSEFIDAIARVLPPGAHITLLRTPLLEQAVAAARPGTTLYVVQPSKDHPVIYRRDGSSGEWKSLAELPGSFDPDREILILRLYRGYMHRGDLPQIFTPPLWSEDHYLFALNTIPDALYGRGRKGDGAETVVAELNQRPALLMGLSILAWNHRKLLNDVFNGKALPHGSLALVGDDAELGYWTSGAGLPGNGDVQAIRGSPDDLIRWLRAIADDDRCR